MENKQGLLKSSFSHFQDLCIHKSEIPMWNLALL